VFVYAAADVTEGRGGAMEMEMEMAMEMEMEDIEMDNDECTGRERRSHAPQPGTAIASNPRHSPVHCIHSMFRSSHLACTTRNQIPREKQRKNSRVPSIGISHVPTILNDVCCT
jgi:hypothetical protein